MIILGVIVALLLGIAVLRLLYLVVLAVFGLLLLVIGFSAVAAIAIAGGIGIESLTTNATAGIAASCVLFVLQCALLWFYGHCKRARPQMVIGHDRKTVPAAVGGSKRMPSTDVQALLRGSNVLEDVRREIELRTSAVQTSNPGRPWKAHTEVANAIGRTSAFFWVAESFITIGRSLGEASSGNRMARVSHDIAATLLRQGNDYLTIAAALLYDPAHGESSALPVQFPSLAHNADDSPVPYLKGPLRATQSLDGMATLAVADYVTAAGAARAEVGRALPTQEMRMQAQLAAAQSHLAIAEGYTVPILGGKGLDAATCTDVEQQLWAALQIYLWLG